MPRYLSLLQMGTLARPRNRSKLAPRSEVLGVRLAPYRHLLVSTNPALSARLTYQLHDYGNGRERYSSLVSAHQGNWPMHRIAPGILIVSLTFEKLYLAGRTKSE